MKCLGWKPDDSELSSPSPSVLVLGRYKSLMARIMSVYPGCCSTCEVLSIL